MTDEPPITSRDEWLEDGWLLLRLHVRRAHLDFESYEVTSMDGDGRVSYQRRGAASDDPVESTDEAARFIAGVIKWDGCSHVYFGDRDRGGYLHLCGPEMVRCVGLVLDRALAVAAAEMPTWHP